VAANRRSLHPPGQGESLPPIARLSQSQTLVNDITNISAMIHTLPILVDQRAATVGGALLRAFAFITALRTGGKSD
jgi:hypothetical protein